MNIATLAPTDTLPQLMDGDIWPLLRRYKALYSETHRKDEVHIANVLEIYAHAVTFWVKNGYSPTLRDFFNRGRGRAKVSSTSVVYYYFQKLERCGLLMATPRASRTIVPVELTWVPSKVTLEDRNLGNHGPLRSAQYFIRYEDDQYGVARYDFSASEWYDLPVPEGQPFEFKLAI
jgi:hypothetical protein